MRMISTAVLIIGSAFVGTTSAVAGPMVLNRIAAPSVPIVQIAKVCVCVSITSSGHCTEYDCHDLLPLVFGGSNEKAFTQVRRASDCPRSRKLLCDDRSCKVVCETKKY